MNISISLYTLLVIGYDSNRTVSCPLDPPEGGRSAGYFRGKNFSDFG
jgi:hypothetical protein